MSLKKNRYMFVTELVVLDKKYLQIQKCLMIAPPPSPTTMPPERMDTFTSTEESYYSVRVPYGTVVVLEKWCSTDFYNKVLKGSNPRVKGYTCNYLIDEKFAHVFKKLEIQYADKLWNALKKRGTSGSLHFNFNRNDFSQTGIGSPRLVCNMFLNELTKTGDYTICKRSNGKFHGMHYNVWGNRAFTTHFTW